jgi:hypothetical protein
VDHSRSSAVLPTTSAGSAGGLSASSPQSVSADGPPTLGLFPLAFTAPVLPEAVACRAVHRFEEADASRGELWFEQGERLLLSAIGRGSAAGASWCTRLRRAGWWHPRALIHSPALSRYFTTVLLVARC